VNGLTELHRFEWNGMLLEISYEPQWLPPAILGEDLAHLEVRSLCPTDAPLPITETGYRSHFIAASAIAAAGGPVAYVDVWLTVESDAPAWREHEEATRQLALLF
jgi:hypothetical protein